MHPIITLFFYIKLCSIRFSITYKRSQISCTLWKSVLTVKTARRYTAVLNTPAIYATAIFITASFFDTGIPHIPSTVCHVRCLRAADEGTNQRITLLKDFKAHNCNRPITCLLYTSPSPRDRQKSRMPSSA